MTVSPDLYYTTRIVKSLGIQAHARFLPLAVRVGDFGKLLLGGCRFQVSRVAMLLNNYAPRRAVYSLLKDSESKAPTKAVEALHGPF